MPPLFRLRFGETHPLEPNHYPSVMIPPITRSRKMLVLSRRIEETILIDGRIEIQIVRVKGNTVKVGIRAPEDVKILRGELAPFGKDSDSLKIERELIELPGKVA
jgi:carbon storage regulator CsrA